MTVDSIQQPQKLRFIYFVTLAAVTFIPLVGIPISEWLIGESSLKELTAFALLTIFMFQGHVAATAYFCIDGELKHLIRKNWRSFLLIPTLLTCTLAIAAVIDRQVLAVGIFAYILWQFYHYQRQNFGIIAFAAASEKSGRPPAMLNTMLNLAMVSGFLGHAGPIGLVGMVFPETPVLSSQIALVLHQIGIVTYGIAVVCFVLMIVQNSSFFSKPFTCLFTTGSLLFFLPAILSRVPVIAFSSYAIAHGAQYFIFMGIVAAQSKRPRYAVHSLVAMTALFCLVLITFPLLGGGWEYVAFGITSAHFIIDAKVWRLREPVQRKIIGDRFAFLFD